jgi:DNA gyrase subunit A
VRGIRLADGDSVISMAILRAVAATPEERAAYVKHARAMARAASGETDDADEAAAPDDEEATSDISLSPQRIAELGAAEEIILTVSTEGFGKRTSAYEFRRTGRGGQGLLAQDLTKRGGRLAGSFPVDESDQILLVSDQGQLIRIPVRQVRLAGRNTQGVIIFRKAEGEHVVSVERLADSGEDDAENGEGGDGDAPAPPAIEA